MELLGRIFPNQHLLFVAAGGITVAVQLQDAVVMAFHMAIQPHQDKKCFIKGVNCLDLGVGPQEIRRISKSKQKELYVHQHISASLTVLSDPMESILMGHLTQVITVIQEQEEIPVEIQVEKLVETQIAIPLILLFIAIGTVVMEKELTQEIFGVMLPPQIVKDRVEE